MRPFGLAKYLPEWDWEPTVLTSKDSTRPSYPFTVIEIPKHDQLEPVKKLFNYNSLQSNEKNQKILLLNVYKDLILTKIGSPIAEIVNYPDANIGWYHDAFEAGSTLLSNYEFDAIISTSGPETTHIIAHALSRKFNLPWIADLRDLWTQFHIYPYSNIRRFFERKLERQILGSASALVTVSEPLKEKLHQLHGDKQVFVIPNGFDPDDQGIEYPQLKNGFTIVYTGKIFKEKQDPTPLFKALRTLIDQRKINPRDIQVIFFGCNADWLKKSIIRFNLGDIVQPHIRISHEKSLIEQRQAQILLLLSWNDPEEKGVYTGKVFEYLNAKRPIISMGISGSVIDELLEETQAGIHIATQEAIEQYIYKAYKEFKEDGYVHYHARGDAVNRYSQKEMAKKFADVLNGICDPSRSPLIVNRDPNLSECKE